MKQLRVPKEKIDMNVFVFARIVLNTTLYSNTLELHKNFAILFVEQNKKLKILIRKLI